MTELRSSLLEKGIETYYRITPFYEEKHKANFVKRAIHNQAMRIIEINTTLKRGRLTQEDDGSFVNKITSIMSSMGDFIDFEDESSQDSFEIATILRKIEAFHSAQSPVIQKVIDHYLSVPVNDWFLEYWKEISKGKSERKISCSDSLFQEALADFYMLPLFTIKFVKWRITRIIQTGE